MLAEHGAVSEPVAVAMAQGALIRSRAQWSIAITGIAGPAGGSWRSLSGPCVLPGQRPMAAGRPKRTAFQGDRSRCGLSRYATRWPGFWRAFVERTGGAGSPEMLHCRARLLYIITVFGVLLSLLPATENEIIPHWT